MYASTIKLAAVLASSLIAFAIATPVSAEEPSSQSGGLLQFGAASGRCLSAIGKLVEYRRVAVTMAPCDERDPLQRWKISASGDGAKRISVVFDGNAFCLISDGYREVYAPLCNSNDAERAWWYVDDASESGREIRYYLGRPPTFAMGAWTPICLTGADAKVHTVDCERSRMGEWQIGS